MSSRLVTYILCSPRFFIFLIFFEQLVSCEKTLDTNDFLRTIKNLDLELIDKIEEGVGLKINSIEKILLKGANNDKITTITEITKVVAEKVLEQTEQHRDEEYEKHGVTENITSVIVPSNFLCAMLAIHEILQRVFKNHVKPHRIPISRLKIYEMLDKIPSRFLCAWSSVLRFLDVISTQENLKVFTYSKKRIFQLADEAAKRDSIPRKGLRRLSKDEFIAVVKKLAPKLEDNMIQKVADHAVADYTFRGERIIYHEKVLAYFTGWINYLKNSARRLHSKLMMELKQPHLYNGTELGAEAQIFALIMARDHLLAHHVEKCFWQKYGMMILHGCDKQFDHILDSEYIGGWYYTEQSIRLVQLLVRAKELIELPRFHIPLEYERFSERPEVGMPQSSACRCSFAKNDIQYGMTTSLPPK
ncbi:uncharacterized protein LOC135839589 isoform X1 [Planococcus citri]|uniref:uncharacterized protein LOC135839589 isoform X1 n=1 Tax=Planococcus citri TaxID=170843 RepID=UPI0031F9D55D